MVQVSGGMSALADVRHETSVAASPDRVGTATFTGGQCQAVHLRR
jgi:hypothetical protein